MTCEGMRAAARLYHLSYEKDRDLWRTKVDKTDFYFSDTVWRKIQNLPPSYLFY